MRMAQHDVLDLRRIGAEFLQTFDSLFDAVVIAGINKNDSLSCYNSPRRVVLGANPVKVVEDFRRIRSPILAVGNFSFRKGRRNLKPWDLRPSFRNGRPAQ